MTEQEFEDRQRQKISCYEHVDRSNLAKTYRDKVIVRWQKYLKDRLVAGDIDDLRGYVHKLLWWCGERERFFIRGDR